MTLAPWELEDPFLDSPNIYYNPGHYGLRVVAEIDYSSGSYEFDTRVVWIAEDGALYTARSEGCSCPTPFDEFRTLDSLDRVDYDELRRELGENVVVNPRGYYGERGISPSVAGDFLKKVLRAVDRENLG